MKAMLKNFKHDDQTFIFTINLNPENKKDKETLRSLESADVIGHVVLGKKLERENENYILKFYVHNDDYE